MPDKPVITSKNLEAYLNALDIEEPRGEVDTEKRGKIRDSIRADIEKLKLRELDRIDREGK